MNATADPFKRLARARLDDALFAAAFDAVRETDKAAFKRCIAAHFADAPPAPLGRLERIAHRGGFTVLRAVRPPVCVALLLPAAPVSPVKLLAALLPARTSGAAHVAVVRPAGWGWEDQVLTALELAGQEDVFAVTPEVWARCCADLAKVGGPCAVLDLQAGQGRLAVPDGIQAWRAPAAPSIGVFYEEEGEGVPVDPAVLVRFHPDSRITLWNAPRRTRGAAGRRGTFAAFAAARHDAVFVPEARLSEALEHCPLALGPGGEAHWFWPGLDARLLGQTRIGFMEGE